MTPALSILVLTEDSSPLAHETWTKLARKLLQLVERDTRTNHVQFEPAEQTTRLGVHANLWKSWKSPNPRDQRSIKLLRRTLATKVLEDGVPGFVLFHFDGDRAWGDRGTAENDEKFDAFVESLRSQVEENLRERNLPSDRAAVDARLLRICKIVPYYSIEAWLYQSAGVLQQFCQAGCGKHLDLIGKWQANRSLLDEVLRPKAQLCIGSRRNSDLAGSFTCALAEELHRVEKSFHATVERLRLCPGLQAALRATWDTGNGDASSSGQQG